MSMRKQCGMVRINLCDGFLEVHFGREQTRLTGAGLFTVNTIWQPTRTPIGWWTMAIQDPEQSGMRQTSAVRCATRGIFWCLFDGARRGGLGAAAWVPWVRDEDGTFEKVSHGGKVLRESTAMVAEREPLRWNSPRQKVASLISL